MSSNQNLDVIKMDHSLLLWSNSKCFSQFLQTFDIVLKNVPLLEICLNNINIPARN